MTIRRRRERTSVDIPVTLTTVLDSLDARIVDLSEQGAQIVGAAMAKGARFQIEFMGQTVYAQCMWSEVDRMGVRFPFGLTDGPLWDALMMASTGHPWRQAVADPSALMAGRSLDESLSRRPVPVLFGRRGTH